MESPLLRLAASLSMYDSVDLLESIAGIQLIPNNIERTLRLEALAHVAASFPENSAKPKISKNKLRYISNSMIPQEITRMEDPFETPFTDEISFYGGSYIVFPGYGGDSVFVFRHLLKSIFLFPDDFRNSDFMSNARELISAVLSLSDEIARSIGLKRGIEPNINNNQVYIPKTSSMVHLKRAVSFTQSRLDELLTKRYASVSSLEKLIKPIGAISISNYKIDEGELLIRPIVKTKEKYIIALPGILLWAARHAIINLAIEYNVYRELARNFNRSVTNSVIEYLKYLENDLYKSPFLASPEIACFSDALFTLDSDKVIYAIILTDPLDDYDPCDINGLWQTDNLVYKISNKLKDVAGKLFSMEKPPNDILFLFIFQGFGRMFTLGVHNQFEPFGIRFLSMSASDLETIALLECNDPLTLWKYALASSNIRKAARVFSFDTLDEFQLYRKNHYSYYFFDDKKPTGLFISPGGAGELRIEAANKRDMHGAVSYINGYIMDVIALHGDKKCPIYIPKFS